MVDLKGKKALITGASRGIGRAIALELAACGAEIFLHYANNTGKAKETLSEISTLGVPCRLIQADLNDPAQTKACFSKTGGVDILVLNASTQIKNEWDKITEDEFSKQVNCNFLSSLLLLQQYIPHMQKQRFGRVVTIGSVQETKPHPQMLVYAATKAAQTSMAMSLAMQLAPYAITVNNVAPGTIYTDRNKQALHDPAYAKKVMDSIPLHFFGEPKDIAATVRLLCSDEGRYITGQSIYIDGGKSL